MKIPDDIEQDIDEIREWLNVNKDILPDSISFTQMVMLLDMLIDIYDMNDARKNICNCVKKMPILYETLLMNKNSFH